MAKSFHGQLTSKKPFDRIFALGKIASILKTYEGMELNQMDKQLIKGFYSNNLNINGFLERSKSSKTGGAQAPKPVPAPVLSTNKIDAI